MVVFGRNCLEINEYVHRDGDCQECPRCIKGYGINITQKINHSDRGMLSCYSCNPCPDDFYQDDNYVLKTCQLCDKCKHRQILRNCSETENRICGDCLPGYFIQSNKRSIICDENAAGNNFAMILGIILGICLISLLVNIGFCIKDKSWLMKKVRSVCGRKEGASKDSNKNEKNADTSLEMASPETPLLQVSGDTPIDEDSAETPLLQVSGGEPPRSISKSSGDKPLLEESPGDCKKSNSKNEYCNDSLIHMPLVQHTEDDVKCNRSEEAIKANPEQYEAVDDNKFALGIGKV